MALVALLSISPMRLNTSMGMTSLDTFEGEGLCGSGGDGEYGDRPMVNGTGAAMLADLGVDAVMVESSARRRESWTCWHCWRC